MERGASTNVGLLLNLIFIDIQTADIIWEGCNDKLVAPKQVEQYVMPTTISKYSSILNIRKLHVI